MPVANRSDQLTALGLRTRVLQAGSDFARLCSIGPPLVIAAAKIGSTHVA
jgi:hypothetical protein